MSNVNVQRALKTAFSLTAEEILACNLKTIENIQANNQTPPKGAICPAGFVVLWGHEEISQYMGLRELMSPNDDDTPHMFRWKVAAKQYRRWTADKNGTNRPLNDVNWMALLEYFKANRWALTGETLIRDEMKRILSAQHRITAAFIATLINPNLRFYFIVIDGVVSDVADFIDTGKSRDFRDIAARHTDLVLPLSTLRMLDDTPYLSDSLKARTQILGDIKQAASLLWLRGRGSDINGSTTAYKADKSQFETMLNRFEPLTFTDANGVSVDSTELERAAMRIYAYDQEQGGTLNKYFGRGKLLTAIILASNMENPSDVRVDKIQVGEGTKDVVAITLPETLQVDFDLLEGFCKVAISKVGPFAAFYSDKVAFKGSQLTKLAVLKFGALVNLVKHYVMTKSETTIEPIVNEAGEVTTPGQVVLTCTPIGKATDVIPKLPRATKNPKTGADVIPPFNFPHFGGYDCGLLDRDTLKADAALQAVQDGLVETDEQADPVVE